MLAIALLLDRAAYLIPGAYASPHGRKIAPRTKKPAARAGFVLLADRGSHNLASNPDLALTRRTVTLVFAPQEHHFPIGLGSKRAARVGRKPIGNHATPVTEALHVPLHLEG